MSVWMLLSLAVGVLLHAASAHGSPGWAPRPTPGASRFVRRPTPAPTSTHTPELFDDSGLARTEVFVMEKCCPHISAFAVREYPSAMEDDGWMPGLTFHAYKYQRWLPNCWQIVDAKRNETTTTSVSQRWKRIPRRTELKHLNVAPSAKDSFCLPTRNRLPDTSVSVFYVESADESASFISQPIRNASQLFFNAFKLGGWHAAPPKKTLFRRVFPLAYYYWRDFAPMPRRLITDVRMHATEPNAPFACEDGYESVTGNFNHNFVGDPVAYFCVRYGYGSFVDLRFNLSMQPARDEMFLTDIEIRAKAPHSLRNRSAPRDRYIEQMEGIAMARQTSRLAKEDCTAPLEPIASRYDFWTRHDGSSERIAKLNALNATLSQLNGTTNYSVFTGSGEWLVLCMEKKSLVDASGGSYRSATSFVDRLYLDLGRILRYQRLGVVYNVDEPVEPKQSPLGRIYYDVEDAKDVARLARGHMLDEL